ncbi:MULTISPECIES: thiamine-binding protein, partial [Thermococcus]|uniref:Thiamine-binding protein domain-containing protein n=2 Tax=Thermococcus sibiricus TaxID=172049 RepID=C6A2X8_THESM
MRTLIEATSLGEGFKIIKEPHELMFRVDAKRLSATIRIDNKRNKDRDMKNKFKSVFEKIWGD